MKSSSAAGARVKYNFATTRPQSHESKRQPAVNEATAERKKTEKSGFGYASPTAGLPARDQNNLARPDADQRLCGCSTSQEPVLNEDLVEMT